MIAILGALCAIVPITLDVVASKKALESLQGEWKVISVAIGPGMEFPPGFLDLRYTIAGNKLTWTVQALNGPETGTEAFVINPKTRPATIDTTSQRDGVSGGIWKLEGDTLTLCIPRRGEDRPTDFTPAKGKTVMTLQRVRK